MNDLTELDLLKKNIANIKELRDGLTIQNILEYYNWLLLSKDVSFKDAIIGLQYRNIGYNLNWLRW